MPAAPVCIPSRSLHPPVNLCDPGRSQATFRDAISSQDGLAACVLRLVAPRPARLRPPRCQPMRPTSEQSKSHGPRLWRFCRNCNVYFARFAAPRPVFRPGRRSMSRTAIGTHGPAPAILVHARKDGRFSDRVAPGSCCPKLAHLPTDPATRDTQTGARQPLPLSVYQGLTGLGRGVHGW